MKYLNLASVLGLFVAVATYTHVSFAEEPVANPVASPELKKDVKKKRQLISERKKEVKKLRKDEKAVAVPQPENK